MSTNKQITRRRLLTVAITGTAGAIAATVFRQPARAANVLADAGGADPRIQGPFLILSTPFTASGAVDFDALAKQACYVDWCGCPGMIWPQSGDSVDLLTTDEKLQGMEVLAKTARKLSTTALCLGVQGKDTAEMLMFAEHVEKLAPPAIISRPPDSGKTEDDLRRYWQALAAVTKRPVFIQTTGGVAYKGPIPSVDLLIELARDFPNFGYVKEEAGNVIARTRALLAAKPPIRRVFSARGGFGWLYELRLGSEGLITERAIYADVLTRIWQLHKSGSDPAALRESFGSFGLALPVPQLSNLIAGFQNIAPLLVTAIPFGVYDFIEAMDNVESASAAGDDYNVREVLVVDGVNSIIGTVLGSPFPNAVYIGHPGWKAVGGRIGYSLATGVLVITVTLLNIVPVLLNLIPLVAILPILLYIGALIGAQAFQATPRHHAPAIILALIPHFAAWGKGQVDGALTAAGVNPGEIMEALTTNGVLYEGLSKLGGGAILSGLILGAIAVFLLDRKPKLASAYALAGAVLSYFGFIHAEQVQFGSGGLPTPITVGYLLLAALCYGFSYLPYEENSLPEAG